MEIIIDTHFFWGIIVVLMILKINHYIDNNPDNIDNSKWDFIETVFGVIFGWITIIYILIEYQKELFGPIKNKEERHEKS